MGFSVYLATNPDRSDRELPQLVQVPPFCEGSTVAIGGSTEAWISVTYNYSKHFCEALDCDLGLRWLNGKTACETLARLDYAVQQLGTERYTGPYWVIRPDAIFSASPGLVSQLHDIDWLEPAREAERDMWVRRGFLYNTGGYWRSTPGNAGYILSLLYSWATLDPWAEWSVD